MFLELNHTKLKVYKHSRRFVVESYKMANALPSDEKFAMMQQIKRAALSVHLNIAEGSSRKSGVERKRFYEISKGSIIEVDAAIDIADDLNYLENYDTSALGIEMIEVFKLVSGLINAE
jgi:four helix bundle protein